MSENVLAYPPADAGATNVRPRAFDTILYGGLAVGALDALDALDALTFFGLIRGGSPLRIFQSIASGLVGPAAFNGGLKTALLGLPVHFLIAFIIATVYYLASLRLPVLIRRAVVCGLLYGVAVYFVMSRIVVPLSAAPTFKTSFAGLLNGVIGHALLVGLPVALIARRSAKRVA